VSINVPPRVSDSPRLGHLRPFEAAFSPPARALIKERRSLLFLYFARAFAQLRSETSKTGAASSLKRQTQTIAEFARSL
jgi:hypothetical protein